MPILPVKLDNGFNLLQVVNHLSTAPTSLHPACNGGNGLPLACTVTRRDYTERMAN